MATNNAVDVLCSRESTSSWLRSSTRSEHSAAESQLDIAQVRDLVDFAGFLCGWRRVWREVGLSVRAIEARRAPLDVLQCAAAASTGWLDADLCGLADLGAYVPDVDTGSDGPALTNGIQLRRFLQAPAGGWGVAYVLLGSRLGGSVIAPQMSAALSLEEGFGTQFLSSSGTSPHRDWAAFKRRLDSTPFTGAELAVATDAARWTFGWVGAVHAAPWVGASSAPS